MLFALLWNLLLFPGVILPSLVPADSVNNDVFAAASSSEGKTEQGEELKEEESPGSSKELENPEESDASWTIQMVSKTATPALAASSLFLHPLLCLKLFPDVTSQSLNKRTSEFQSYQRTGEMTRE